MSDVPLPPEIDKRVEDEKDRELLQRVTLGEDFERFVKSHLGRFLCRRAEQERGELLEKLVQINPFDQQAISTVQRRIWALDAWQQWCAEAITEGSLAESEFIARNE